MVNRAVTTPLPGWPRGMPEPLAAGYVGLSVSTIRAERARGAFPAPVRLTAGRQVYLREHLDAYLDKMAGAAGAAASNPWDAV